MSTEPNTSSLSRNTMLPRLSPAAWSALALCLLAVFWVAWQVALQWESPGLRRALRDGLMCAGATTLGAMVVLVVRRLPQRLSDAMLGFGAGVMLAATAFSLLLPALNAAGEQVEGGVASGLVVSLGVCMGVAGMLLLDRLIPHAHLDPEGHTTRRLQGLRNWLPPKVALFVLAILLHNIPEGMAVGVAASSGMPGAEKFSIAIALQDAPEGMVVALALFGAGVSRLRAAFLGMLSGLVEPMAGLPAALAINASTALLPWGLAFAGGAMLFAVSHEVIPESHRNGHETSATIGLVLGFCLMMVMDTGLA